MAKINLDLASGFRDYLPREARLRLKMIETIRSVFERFGFQPFDTPSVERMEILSSEKSDVQKQIIKLADKDKLGLRFDLTVPLARAVASYPDLGRPLKRYQIGNVFRGEKAQAGRYREFLQFDADIVGSSSPMADAEMISLIYETFKALGLEKFTIRIGHRKALEKIIVESGFLPRQVSGVMRIIDKIDKIGWDGIIPALKRIAVRDITRKTNKLKDGISDFDYKKSSDFVELARNLVSLGVSETNYKFDVSVARGLEYYTGMVCEAVLDDMPEIGSVFSGGRYDNLVSRFGRDMVPTVGASVGVDRLFTALEKLGFLKGGRIGSSVLILNFETAAHEAVQRIATDLRRDGISAEIYLGKEITLKGQLAYAVSHEYPVVIIVGADELKRGVAQIKDIQVRTQVEAPILEIAARVTKILKAA